MRIISLLQVTLDDKQFARASQVLSITALRAVDVHEVVFVVARVELL